MPLDDDLTNRAAALDAAWSALTGYLVIGSISNGMDLLALPSSIKYMITGGVLLLAVTADAFFRRVGRPARA